MRLRRAIVEQVLKPNEYLLSMTNFPMMGTKDFTVPFYAPNGPICKSSYVPDQLMGVHPRFGTLSANIRERRGKKVNIKIPLYKVSERLWLTTVSARAFFLLLIVLLICAAASLPVCLPTSSCVLLFVCMSTLALLLSHSFATPPTSVDLPQDVNTDKVSSTNVAPPDEPNKQKHATDDEIHMDAMAFGMGCCCLQVRLHLSVFCKIERNNGFVA